MSLIAGYLTRKSKHETAFVEKKVKSYNILSYEDFDDYENVVIETKFGHIIQKYTKDYPIQSRPCKDVNGNLLVTLGFLYTSDLTTSREKLLELCVGNAAKVLEECEGGLFASLLKNIPGRFTLSTIVLHHRLSTCFKPLTVRTFLQI